MNKLDKFHKTKSGLALFGLVELAIAYGFAGLAIDRGNLLWYALGLVFLVGGLRNLFNLIGVFLHDSRRR